MNIRKIALLATAGLVALGTAQATRWMTAPPAAPIAGTLEPVPVQAVRKVLVAAADLPAGTLVQADQLRWREWPEDGSDGYMVEGLRTREEFVGAVVRTGMRAGEPVLETRLVKPGERGFLAAVLEPGMRAVTVPVNAVTGIAGFVFPGDRVDVILTHAFSRPDDIGLQERRVSETLLTDVRVLALDQKTNDQEPEPTLAQTATLEVTPKQTELLPLAIELGQLSLALRSLDRSAELEAEVARAAAGGRPGALSRLVAEAAARKAPAPRSFTWDSDASAVLPDPADKEALIRKVRVLRGNDAGEVAFDRSRR